MSIAPLAAPAAPNPAGRIGDAARVIGRFTFRTADETGTALSRVQLRTNGTFGSRTGYSSLTDAVEAARYLTTGDVSAAAIFESAGRYYAYRTLADVLAPGSGRTLSRFDLESSGDSYVYDFRRLERVARLKAVVDGDFVHRFRAPLSSN